MPLDLKLENQPRSTQVLLFALLGIGFVVAAYMLIYKDLLASKSRFEGEIKRLEISVMEATAVQTQLEKFKQELARLDARLVQLRSILPDQKETPKVMRNVQEMAASSNLKIIKFNPQPVVPKAFYSDWPIEIEVQGSYNSLGAFFEKIGRYARIINVDNINMKGIEGSTDSNRTLISNCKATTFVYREEQPPQPGN